MKKCFVAIPVLIVFIVAIAAMANFKIPHAHSTGKTEPTCEITLKWDNGKQQVFTFP